MCIPLRAKALGALIVVSALALLSTAPAGAGTITGASLSMGGDTFVVPDLSGPCASGGDSIDATVTSSTVSVSGFDLTLPFEVFGTGSGDWWMITLSLATQNSGTVSGSTISGVDLTLDISIENRDDSTCADLPAPACTGHVGLLLDGTWTSTPAPDTAFLSGTSWGSSYGNTTDLSTACGSSLGDYLDAVLDVDSLNANVNP